MCLPRGYEIVCRQCTQDAETGYIDGVLMFSCPRWYVSATKEEVEASLEQEGKHYIQPDAEHSHWVYVPELWKRGHKFGSTTESGTKLLCPFTRKIYLIDSLPRD